MEVQKPESTDNKPLVKKEQIKIASIKGMSSQRQVRITSDRLQKIYQRLSTITILIPFLGTIAAIALLWYFPLQPVVVVLAVGLYALTILGVEVGFHRLFSHHAFETTTPVRVILAILGSMAAQGGVVFWVAHHRCHHQYTDRPNDPHSPNLHEDGLGGRLQGFWHAHAGWILAGEIPNSMLFAKDILRDPAIAKVNQWQQYWVLLGLVIPSILGGLLTQSWIGALQGLLWGGFVRIFLGQQVINSTNSICHLYGGRSFSCEDCSTNNLWLAIPSWGQSWHNNHHAFPNSAMVGMKWWQIDPGNWTIRLLEKMGLAWQVREGRSKKGSRL
jgi:stearoyl-CoA desaturase (Delta-9 desaturase)